MQHSCGMRYAIAFILFLSVSMVLVVSPGCSAPPDLTGFPANTPAYSPENKVFFLKRLPTNDQYSATLVDLEHLYQVDSTARASDIIDHNDPISVILQGVRIPESLPGGTRDIAVVLDIQTSSSKGLVSLVAFYQRDVTAGQMLNFNNLLVYADPMWDSSNPPYFRMRVMDVKAERNRRTGALLSKVSNLSSEIGGMVPHPAIPLVTTAIDMASLVLSNQQNIMLLDYQIQFYGAKHVNNAGGATLGPLVAGSWLAVGRQANHDATFWKTPLKLERKTDRLVTQTANNTTAIPVPYIMIALAKADAQVPQLVLDRSSSLLQLLGSSSGKSDLDALEAISGDLASATKTFILERRLRKYRSMKDLQKIIDQLNLSATINSHELSRLIYIMNAVTPNSINTGLTTPADWVTWWQTNGGSDGKLVESKTLNDGESYPLGIAWTP